MDSRSPEEPINPGRIPSFFAIIYVLAHTGAFIGFIPLFTLLLPLKVQELAPRFKGELLSWLLVSGAACASVANVACGGLSDALASRGHGRGGLIGVGAIGMALGLLAIYASETPAQLTCAFMAFQIFLNAVLAPMSVLLAEEIPEDQRAPLAGWLSLSNSAATLIGAPLLGIVLTSAASRYETAALIVVGSVLPFAVLLGRMRRPRVSESARPAAGGPSWGRADFRRLWFARFLMQCAVFPTNAYLLFYLEEGWHGSSEAHVAALITLSTLAGAGAGPIAGHLQARVGRTRLGLASGLAVTGALVLLCLRSGHAAVAVALLGAGFGAFSTLETALAAHLVADLKTSARDLGVLNLAYTLPQLIMPLFAALVLSARSMERYGLLFATAAALAFLAGVVLARAGGAPVERRTTSVKGSDAGS